LSIFDTKNTDVKHNGYLIYFYGTHLD